jgi:uncharacterized membrane protein
MNRVSFLVKIIRSHFLAGILVLIPLWVTVWLLRGIFNSIRNYYLLLPDAILPKTYFNPQLAVLIDGILVIGFLIALIIITSFIGWGSKNFIGQKILKWISLLIQRIPVLGAIYNSLDQLLKTLASGSDKQFRRVVYVEFPRKDMWTIAFVTGSAIDPLPPGYLNIFVAAVPNPTSGFFMMVKESEVIESHLTVEQAFKMILSFGIVHPHPPAKAGS